MNTVLPQSGPWAQYFHNQDHGHSTSTIRSIDTVLPQSGAWTQYFHNQEHGHSTLYVSNKIPPNCTCTFVPSGQTRSNNTFLFLTFNNLIHVIISVFVFIFFTYIFVFMRIGHI
jgi:hypothetical protein